MASPAPSFEQIIDAAIELLQRRQRLTYGALKRQFALDDAAFEDLRQELLIGQRVARDEGGAVLVWQGREAAPAERHADPERRQITIAFCDLAESTALSNALDPEELRVVLRAFQETAGGVIARHGGFVNSYMGDGILVFFGYPQAHEDDARRAVRAGLEVVQAVATLRPLAEIRLRVRVGIATGIVVVGDVIGSGVSREEAVVGNTSNLAARLQGLARPGEVVISESTRRLLGGAFDCVDLGAQTLKGFDEPVPAWQAVQERAVEEISDAGGAGGDLAPLVDREVEFPALLSNWRMASGGTGRAVTLRGEAGLGKSRLGAALRQTVMAQGHLVLRYYCATRFANSALYPVIRHLVHAAQLSDDEAPAVRLDKLEKLLQHGTSPEEMAATLPYIAALLGVPTGERYAPIADSPERQREQTLNALAAQILGLARLQPVLMIFEDLHWVDPTTLLLIDRVVRRIAEVPVMLLATARPDFDPPWAGLPQAQTVELSLFEREHRSAIVDRCAAGKALPPEILEHIVQKSDGVPLFVEELTKALLESGLLEERAGRYELTGPLRTLTVPSTLHDSLLARLDRLSVVKDVVQAGAAIGREFGYEMLAALQPLDSVELQATLARLSDAGLVHSRGTPPHAVYRFKHALIQDAAYDTMLRPKRQGLHARIAELLEADAGTAGRAPELLAHHLIEAGLPARAIPYLLQAGRLAGASAAHVEACKHFDEGLRLLPQVSDEETRNRLEMNLRVHLGMSLAATRGFAAPEVESTNQRARELCRLIGATDELYWVLRGLCALYIVRADAAASRELADACVRLGEETQRAEFLIEGYLMRGYTLCYAGELDAGCAALARSVEIYRTRDGASFPFPTPQNPAVASLSMLAVACLLRGRLQAAAAHAQDAIDTAAALQRPFEAAYAHCFVAMYENLRGDAPRAAQHAGIAIEIAMRHGFAGWQAAGAMQLGVAKAALGEADEAIGLLGATLPAWQASGAELNSGYFLAGLAAAHAAAGKVGLALEAVDKAIAHAAQHGEHFYDAALYRLRGELTASSGSDAAPAAADLQQALDIAQRQGARLLELRAATSLARAVLPAAERDRARAQLAAALAQMAAEPDSADHRAAAAVLEARAA